MLWYASKCLSALPFNLWLLFQVTLFSTPYVDSKDINFDTSKELHGCWPIYAQRKDVNYALIIWLVSISMLGLFNTNDTDRVPSLIQLGM